MITILNISDTKFSYNGIAYFKNFTPFVTGNKVSIVNTYDACISLTNFPTIYSDISVDGVTYGSVSALQNALLPVLFNRTFTQAGSLGVGYIQKATGINTLGNSLIYDNGTNIGVGTTATLTKLTINGNLSLFTTNQIRLYNSAKNNWTEIASPLLGGDSEVDFRILTKTGTFYINSSGNVGVATTNPDNGKLTILKATSRATESSYGIAIQSNASNIYTELLLGADDSVDCGIIQTAAKNTSFTTKKLALQPQGGNVGIGTTSPLNKLHVDNGGIRLSDTTNSNFRGITFGANATDSTEYAYIKYNPSSGEMRYWANPSGFGGFTSFYSNNAESMRITSGGDVCIGTTSSTAGGVTMKTHISGTSFGLGISVDGSGSQQNIRFVNGTTAVGSVVTTSSTTTYNTISDYRLKQDLKPIIGLDLISKIKVYDYEWKVDQTRAYGVLAHELQEIIPQAVNGKKDAEEMQSVDYSKLVPILVQAIKELKQEIQILKN